MRRNRTKSQKIPEYKIDKVKRLRSMGFTVHQIAKVVRIGVSTVNRILYGRKIKNIPQDKKDWILNNQSATSTEAAKELGVSPTTAIFYFESLGIKRSIPKYQIILDLYNEGMKQCEIARYLKISRQHVNNTITNDFARKFREKSAP